MTPAQQRELRALAREPQTTYGFARTRVQNTLVRLGLARYTDGVGYVHCEITDEGRKALRAVE